MSDKEKEKFREHLNQFSREQLEGWISTIAFIWTMDEVNPKLIDKLKEMFDICSDVIRGKE